MLSACCYIFNLFLHGIKYDQLAFHIDHVNNNEISVGFSHSEFKEMRHVCQFWSFGTLEKNIEYVS